MNTFTLNKSKYGSYIAICSGEKTKFVEAKKTSENPDDSEFDADEFIARIRDVIKPDPSSCPDNYRPKTGEHFTVNESESGYRANVNRCLLCTYSDESMIVFKGDLHSNIATLSAAILPVNMLRPLNSDAVIALCQTI